MGIDLLDINFRIEREFGVRIAVRDLIHLVDNGIHDPTAGELFHLLIRSLKDSMQSQRDSNEEIWMRLQSIIAETCAIPPASVARASRLFADLGCE